MTLLASNERGPLLIRFSCSSQCCRIKWIFFIIVIHNTGITSQKSNFNSTTVYLCLTQFDLTLSILWSVNIKCFKSYISLIDVHNCSECFYRQVKHRMNGISVSYILLNRKEYTTVNDNRKRRITFTYVKKNMMQTVT